MKKVWNKIKDFICNLLKPTHTNIVWVGNSEELLSHINDKKELKLKNSIQLLDTLILTNTNCKINLNGYDISGPVSFAGLDYPFLDETGWYITDEPIQVKDDNGEFKDAIEKPAPGSIYSIHIPIKAYIKDLDIYEYITFSVGWTSYTWPIVEIKDGYIYMRALTSDYNPNYDYIRYNYGSQFKLGVCFDDKYNKQAIIIDNSRVNLYNGTIHGGISATNSDIHINKVHIEDSVKHGISCLNSDLYATDCVFINMWRSAIYSKGKSYMTVSNCSFNKCSQSMENYGTIQTEGQYTIFNNRFNNFGAFGIRVGAVQLKNINEFIDETISDNVFYNVDQEGIPTDTGVIYVAPNNNKCVVKNNVIHQGYRGRGNNHGIYLDDGAYNVTVEENTIHVETGYAISARYAYIKSRGYSEDSCSSNKVVIDNMCYNGGIWYRASKDGTIPDGCKYDGNFVPCDKDNKYCSTNKL